MTASAVTVVWFLPRQRGFLAITRQTFAHAIALIEIEPPMLT
jgi:hypothetical protein